MARVIFENLTMEQAKMLADWYEGQGEQDASVWFEENDLEAPMVDVQHKNWKKIVGTDVIVQCK